MALRDPVVGRDPFVSVGAPLVGLLVGGVLRRSYRSLLEGYALVPVTRSGWLVLGLLVLGPAALAVWNDGLVACWSFDFGPILAVYLARYLPEDELVPADPYGVVFTVLALSFLVAVLWGTVGFVLGVGARRLVLSARAWWLARSIG